MATFTVALGKIEAAGEPLDWQVATPPLILYISIGLVRELWTATNCDAPSAREIGLQLESRARPAANRATTKSPVVFVGTVVDVDVDVVDVEVEVDVGPTVVEVEVAPRAVVVVDTFCALVVVGAPTGVVVVDVAVDGPPARLVVVPPIEIDVAVFGWVVATTVVAPPAAEVAVAPAAVVAEGTVVAPGLTDVSCPP